VGRSVMVHPRARVVAYADWSVSYDDYVASWDSFDGDSGPMSRDEFDRDYDQYAEEWVYMLEYFVERVTETWPSFSRVERWPHDEVRVVLQNGLAEMAVSEYCGLTSLSIAPVENVSEGLANNFIDSISDKFLSMFSNYYRIGTFSNGESVYEVANR
jgi:hypothetical protein